MYRASLKVLPLDLQQVGKRLGYLDSLLLVNLVSQQC